jgi:hypothetical protein
MNSTVACILTTYRREEKALRFIRQFDQRFSRFRSRFRIIVADDDPKSFLNEKLPSCRKTTPLNITYTKNEVNLGQGNNHINAVAKHPDFDYYWFPGDDDLIIPEEFADVLLAIDQRRPTIACFEFRQGPNLEFGTFLDGPNRTEKDISRIIHHLTYFGKCTSAIIANPGQDFTTYAANHLSNCMYPDKAMGVFAVLSSTNPEAYIHTNLTAYADAGYSELRYSTRVFANLDLTVKKVFAYHNKLTGSSERPNTADGPGPIYWWWFGIRRSLSRKSQLQYRPKLLFRELLFGLPLALYYRYILQDFQRP